MTTFDELLTELHKDPEFRKEYDRQKPYYDLILEVIRCRKQQNLTQKDLAERVGKQQSAISRIESGEHDIRFSTLIDIADALDTKVELKLVPKFYVSDEEYTELFNFQASSSSSQKHPKSTVRLIYVKV